MFPDGDITGPNGRGLVFRTETIQARTAEAWCSQTGTLQDRTAEAWCSRKGALQAQILSTASDGLDSSAFDLSLEYSTDNVVFWQPRPIFAVVAFVVYRRRRVIFLRGAVYDGRIGQAP